MTAVIALGSISKFQAPKYKFQTNLNDRNSKFKTDRMTAIHRISCREVLVIGNWNFDIIWNLSIVIWDLSAVSGKSNRFYLNLLGMALTFPCQLSAVA